MPSAYKRMMETVAAKLKAEEVKEAPPKKPKKETPPPPLPAPKKEERVVIPEKTLKRLGKKAKEEPLPPPPSPKPSAPAKKPEKVKIDERALAEVSPPEIAQVEKFFTTIESNEIEAMLKAEGLKPWHIEMARAELMRRKMEETRKKFEGKTVEEVLLGLGEVPHYLIQRRPVWVDMPKEQIELEVGGLEPTLLLKLSDYYNALNERGDLRGNEKVAAEAMKKRIWDEAIGEVSIDKLPMLPEELEEIINTQINVRDRVTNTAETLTPLEASNSQLAEWLYLEEDGPTTQNGLKGGPFDTSSPIKNEFIAELKPRFDNEGNLDKVETSLSKQALLKRMLVRHAKVPISMVKERAGVVEAAAVEAAAYMPPEYEQLKGYYRPEFKEMELGESQKMLVKLPPADLLKIYQLYFLLRRKGKLDKKEEYLEEEMRRLLEKMKSVGILEAIPTPRTKPPTQVAPDEFKKYLSWVDVMFNKLSQKDVDELANHPDQNILAKVMTGNGTDEEKMVFVEAMDELFDKVMTGEEFDKFIKSSEGALYNKIYSRYRRTVG